MMDCSDIREWLRRDLDGAAEPSSEAAEHLDRCPACKSEAGRFKAIAEASRAALPPAAVPVDFVDSVMHTLVEPEGDQELADAVRPRWASRLLIIPFVAALVVAAVTLWPRPEVAGAVLDTGASGSSGALSYTALEPSLFSVKAKELHAGVMHFACEEPTTVRTPLGEVHLRAGTACVIRVTESEEIEHMKLKDLKRIVPAFLAVTVFTGSCRVANAQGVEEVEEEKTVEVKKGNPPRVNEDAVSRELNHIAKALAIINKRFDRLSKAMTLQVKRATDAVADVVEVRVPAALNELEEAIRKEAAAGARYETYAVRLGLLDYLVGRSKATRRQQEMVQQLRRYQQLLRDMRRLEQSGGKVDGDTLRNFERSLKEFEQRVKQLAPLKARLEGLERVVKQLMAERARNADLAAQIRALKVQLDVSKQGKAETKWTWGAGHLHAFQRALRQAKIARADALAEGSPTAEWDRVIADLERKLGGDREWGKTRKAKKPVPGLLKYLENELDMNRTRLETARRALQKNPDNRACIDLCDKLNANIAALEWELGGVHAIMEKLEASKQALAAARAAGKPTADLEQAIAKLESKLVLPDVERNPPPPPGKGDVK